MRTCLDCPASLEGEHFNRKRCEPCNKKLKKVISRVYRTNAKKKRKKRKCLDCGTDITGTYGTRKRCEPCAKESILARKRSKRKCLDCGVDLTGTASHKRCPDCGRKHKALLKRQNAKPTKPKTAGEAARKAREKPRRGALSHYKMLVKEQDDEANEDARQKRTKPLVRLPDDWKNDDDYYGSFEGFRAF